MPSDNYTSATNTSSAVIAVSALNQAVARVLERNFPLLWVAGEVSNFTRAASGHWYFTLKDDAAQVRAVMFKGRSQYADFTPREGDKIEVRTLVTLYTPRGDYQLNVEAIRRSGVGNLYESFLRLKKKLEQEGLFAQERKRPIPTFVRSIGIVTSLQAAALRDIFTTLKRRSPHVRVIVYPTPVQGDGAASSIAAMIATASRRNECDVLLVCRGGGSIEDLWAFNDEAVARAVAACAMPVIAGIGHETDFTITDFAADLRAPTPTAAAELATIPRSQWLANLQAHSNTLNRSIKRQLSNRSQTLDWLSRRLISPAAYIAHERVKLQALQTRLAHATQTPLRQAGYRLQHAYIRLHNQLPTTAPARLQLLHTTRRITGVITTLYTQQKQVLTAQAAQLEMLNPQRTLERGYAIVSDKTGKVLRSPSELHPRSTVSIRLAQGNADVSIAAVQEKLETRP